MTDREAISPPSLRSLLQQSKNMRLYLQTTPNIQPVPFTYQVNLVGALHKWLGKNQIHDGISLYSLSRLSHGRRVKSGLNFHQGGQFFISAPDTTLIKQIITGIQNDPKIAWGMRVGRDGVKTYP